MTDEAKTAVHEAFVNNMRVLYNITLAVKDFNSPYSQIASEIFTWCQSNLGRVMSAGQGTA